MRLFLTTCFFILFISNTSLAGSKYEITQSHPPGWLAVTVSELVKGLRDGRAVFADGLEIKDADHLLSRAMVGCQIEKATIESKDTRLEYVKIVELSVEFNDGCANNNFTPATYNITKMSDFPYIPH